jgi:hypothetical protein
VDEPNEFDEHITAVATKVFSTIRESATTADLSALSLAKPSIPRDIDRALLTDLSEVLGVYDLSDALRYRLRDAFWEVVEGHGQVGDGRE